MGIRKTEEMNMALLGKQAWRIITNPNSLLATILLPKYCKNESFTKVSYKPGSSWIWRSILIGRDVVLKGLDFQIWSGQQTKVANGSLTQDSDNNLPQIKELICHQSHTWKIIQTRNNLNQDNLRMLQ